MKKYFIFLMSTALLAPLTAINAAVADNCDVPAYFNYIFDIALGSSAILAITQIVIGAIQIMASSAVPAVQSAGKDRIINALLGLALIFGSWLILYTINPDLVNFCNFGNVFPTPSDQLNIQAGATRYCVRMEGDSYICGNACPNGAGADCPNDGNNWICVSTTNCQKTMQ